MESVGRVLTEGDLRRQLHENFLTNQRRRSLAPERSPFSRMSMPSMSCVLRRLAGPAAPDVPAIPDARSVEGLTDLTARQN